MLSIELFSFRKMQERPFLIDRWNTFLEIQFNKLLHSGFAYQERAYVNIQSFEIFRYFRHLNINETAIIVFRFDLMKP